MLSHWQCVRFWPSSDGGGNQSGRRSLLKIAISLPEFRHPLEDPRRIDAWRNNRFDGAGDPTVSQQTIVQMRNPDWSDKNSGAEELSWRGWM